MFLNSSQIQELYTIFAIAGLNSYDFQYYNDSREFGYYYINDPDNIRLQIRGSIYGASFGDIFCKPYTYRSSIYYGCKGFAECLHFAKECVAFPFFGQSIIKLGMEIKLESIK
jgi:hypothetical protein